VVATIRMGTLEGFPNPPARMGTLEGFPNPPATDDVAVELLVFQVE